MDCRISVSDAALASMLRAVLTLGGFTCGDDGAIRITDHLPDENTPAVYLTEGRRRLPEERAGLIVLPKPVCFDDLIRAVRTLRGEGNSTAVKPAVPDAGGAEITVRDGCVSYRGKTAQLTERELRLFECLRRRSGQTVSRAMLHEEVWDGAAGDTNVADVYIGYLRRKLKPLFGEGVLLSVRGKGYILNLPGM